MIQDSDARERVKEAVVRATIARWIPTAEHTVSNTSDSDCDSSEQQSPYSLWVNPNEVCNKEPCCKGRDLKV